MEYLYKERKVYYESEGEGAPVLMLHGWGCDHTIFSSFVGVLSGKYRVIGLDFPGFGASEEPDGVWGVEEYTSLVESFCKDLNLECPSLISHSFGGRVSILFASRNRVQRMVLADAAGLKPHRKPSYYVKVYFYKTVKFFLLKVLRNPGLFGRYSSGRGSSDYASASPRMKAILSKVVNEDLRDRLPLIQAPTLLFWGTKDTATPISDAMVMEALIPDAGIVKVEGAGHFSFLEAPGVFRSALVSFFEI